MATVKVLGRSGRNAADLNPEHGRICGCSVAFSANVVEYLQSSGAPRWLPSALKVSGTNPWNVEGQGLEKKIQ